MGVRLKGEMNMLTRLNEIHNYLSKVGYSDEEIAKMDSDTYTLSLEICKYAHRNQTRENGEPYEKHPLRLVEKFERLIGESEINTVDLNTLKYFKIPYQGVKEVCLLHDVVEDTDFTLKDIEEIFKECGFEEYSSKYIILPLQFITHNKKEDYEIYVMNLLQNDIASMVKMLDLQDNMMLLDLEKFQESEYKRAQKYLKCFNYINLSHRFIENATKYTKITKHLAKVQYFVNDSMYC